MCGDGARVIRFFARVIQQLGFWTQKIRANVDYCYVRRRADCTTVGPGLEHSQAYAQTLVWPRRVVPRRFTWYFVSTKHPSPARELLLCVYSRMIRSHERRALGALLSLFSRSEPASTDSCSLAAVRRGDCVRASWMYSYSNASIATRTRTLVCTSYYCCCTRPALLS